MKRILTAVLWMALLAAPALADEIYYVNPDGGQFYHAEQQCSSMSSKYWDQLVTVTKSELSQASYSSLNPCPFCVKGPVNQEPDPAFPDPWISRLDTAENIYLAEPGVYVANVDIAQGLYTVRMTDRTAGNVTTSFSDGTIANVFVPADGATYSFYLHDGMILTLPEYAILTPIVKRDPAQQPQRETIRHGRRMLYYEVPDGVYEARAIDGQEGALIFSPVMTDAGLDNPTVFTLAPGETIVFDTCMDGINDPMPIRYFATPDHKAFFVEFVNCVIQPIESGQ